MSGASGDALEWALALWRAPAERFGLRQRVLPEGMGRLLAVAAGVPQEAMAAAARQFGEPEARLQDAARFYAREVLFHPQANAYRCLGVTPGAGPDEIKAHYRLLLHWLHPDRARSAEDAVFAGRINDAWNQLRSPARRCKYDQAWEAASPGSLDSPSIRLPGPRPLADGIPIAAPAWQRRLPAMGLVGACLVLAWLIRQDASREPVGWGPRVVAAGAPVAGGSDPSGESARFSRLPELDMQVYGAASAQAPDEELADIPPAYEAIHVPEAPVPVPPAHAEPSAIATGFAPPAIQQAQPSAAPGLAPGLEQGSPKQVPIGAASAPPDFVQSQRARAVGDQLLHFLSEENLPAPPIWNTPAALGAAQRARVQLHAHHRPRLGGVRWRIGERKATLHATWTTAAAPQRGGSLQAGLVWREQQWLVSDLQLEQAAP